MDIRSLAGHDSEAVAALARAHYPANFELQTEVVAERLRGMPEQANLSFGLFRDGELEGYLMAWVDASQVEGRETESVILLDDIVVYGASRSHLFRLLRALREGILARGLERLAIEGTHRERAEALFMGHPQLMARLGYVLSAQHHYYGEREQENLCWVRYEPLI